MTDSAENPVRRRTETVDRYLETIFYIRGEGEVVRPSRLAEWLGVSAPTVSVTLQRLEREGWVQIARDRSVDLTEQGADAAAGIVRRHRLLERWLTDQLGFDWATADEEAERLTHGVSDVVLERLDAHLGHPSTCPHGNLIPGRPQPERTLVALADLEPDADATVRRISEVAEHDAPLLLRQLEAYGLVPGAAVRVDPGSAEAGALAVQVAGRTVPLATRLAAVIWVQPTDHGAR